MKYAVMVTFWEHEPASNALLDERVVTCIPVQIDVVVRIWKNKTAYGLDVLFVHANEQRQALKPELKIPIL